MGIKKKIRYAIKKADYQVIFKELFYIILGITSASFGLKSFLLPNHFLDGGAMGISLLLNIKTGYSLGVILVLVNIPFVLLGSRQISKMFAFKTIAAIAGLAFMLTFDFYPIITSDKLLIAVFGGFFLGAGIGMAIRGGAVIDGTEVLALYISKKISLSVGDIILVFNIAIFSVAALVLNVETALYAILTYLAASKTVDYIIHGIEEYIGVTIISVENEEIRQAIIKILGRAVTIYKGERGYVKNLKMDEREINIVFTVVTRLEVTKMRNLVKSIDKQAFIVMHTVDDTYGGMVKQRPLHS
ncbi:MAG: YitT family protein [Bacteroidetes bacterium]|nr:YitT family protein [Bacteroidota bacterium]MBU1484994.1 YitT family protein [Bacteroidota bacterium]MBU2046446.1 YitT family protein [Bacteroidota bacterium]MBU2266977.1 YitT family protein [Bacteroidota bacterium]